MQIFTRSKVVVPFSGAHCESTGPHSLFLKTEMASFLWGQSLPECTSARKSRECTVYLLGKCSLATVRGELWKGQALGRHFYLGDRGLESDIHNY